MSGAFAKKSAPARRAKGADEGPAFRRRGRPKGYFLGGLTGGSPGSSTNSFNSTTTTSYDPQYTDYFHNILNRSNSVYGDMQNRTADDAIAGFTPDQIAAQAAVRGNQGAFQPNFNNAQGQYNAAGTAAGGIGTAGAGAFENAASNPGGSTAAQPYFDQASGRFTDPGVANSYMSPYLDAVAANTTRLSNQNLTENILPAVNDTFSGGTMGAQFGRERHADITGRAIRDQQNTLTGNLANIYNTGFGQAAGQYNADQARLGGLGTAAGGLANSTIGAFGNLGSQQTNAAATGVQGQLAAGQAQQGLGTAQQGAGYTDAAALGQSGATQQGLQQQRQTFDLQYPWQLLQTQQGLGQGWQVGSTQNTQGTSTSQQTAAGGSPLGSIFGGGLGIAGLSTSGGGSLGGNFLSGLFSSGGGLGGGSGMTFAKGGPVGRFAAGGYAPLVNDTRTMMQTRMPAIQQRFQAQQQQGGPGMPQPGGSMPPQRGAPAFARGGAVKRRFAYGGFSGNPFFAPRPFGSDDPHQVADQQLREQHDILSSLRPPGALPVLDEYSPNRLSQSSQEEESGGGSSSMPSMPTSLINKFLGGNGSSAGGAGEMFGPAEPFGPPAGAFGQGGIDAEIANWAGYGAGAEGAGAAGAAEGAGAGAGAGSAGGGLGGMMGSLGPIAAIAAAIGLGKNTEANHAGTPGGDILLGALGPSIAQMWEDPIGMGLPTLLGAPFLTPFTASDKAKKAKPEFSGLFGLGFKKGGAVKRRFNDGGYSDPFELANASRGFESPFLDARRLPEGYFERPHPFTPDELRRAERNGRGFFDRARDFGSDLYEGGKELIRDIPAAVGREAGRYADDPLGHAAEVLFPWTPMGAYADMTDATRQMIDPNASGFDMATGAGRLGWGAFAGIPGVGPAGRGLRRLIGR